MVTVADFNRWLRSDIVGPFEYYRGFLIRDRQTKRRHEEAKSLGMIAWLAYLAGKVSLVQKKVGEGVYAYIAQRRK